MQQVFNGSRQRGFTLIEVLLAVILTSVLAGGVYSAFSQGVRLWKRSIEVRPDLESDIVFEKIHADARNVFQSRMRPFGGDKGSLSFFSYSGQDFVDARSGSRIKQPVWVGYRFDEESGSLLRSERTLESLLAPSNLKPKARESFLVRNLLDCTFEYYEEDKDGKSYKWKTSWQAPALPRAVRISLRTKIENQVTSAQKVIALAGADSAL